MAETFDIAEVARATGLSARALRFYEARGLVRPLRTHSGRRCYGAGELERLYQLIALKRAGLTLADIKALFDRRPIDLRELLALKLADIDAKVHALTDIRHVLATTLSRIDRGEPIDAATFCSLIRSGDIDMTTETEKWKAITDRYLSNEGQADFDAKRHEMGQALRDFDQASYAARWRELGGRIKAALPLDPASAPAQAFLAEWKALLEPFARVATPAMMEGSRRMYENMEQWEGEADPGFDHQVYQFIQTASAATRQ